MSEEVNSWLKRLGLGQYAEAFAENDIDLGILSELSESDLAGLGISLGHRKRLLRAVAEQAIDNEAALSPESGSRNQIDDSVAWSRHPGEHKPVTLLFADITGSTALTETLDPEDAHERLYGAVQQMCEAVEAERGTVCRFMGDGIMAMFGAPIAFEDHPSRACSAALALQAQMRRYGDALEHEYGCRIQARVGLHAGEVVVLNVGDAGRAEYDASGPSVALAARMEQTAEPGTVQMTATTFSLVETNFEGESLPAVSAKGFSEPVPVVRLLERREGGASNLGLPFIGRRAELGQLRVLLDECGRERNGRTVIVRGEPGIGKTRLVERLIDEAKRSGFCVHRSVTLDFGWVQGQDPARLLLRSLLGLDAEASEEQRRQAAQKAIRDGLAEREHLAHLLDLLSLPPPTELEAGYSALGAGERASQRNALLGAIVQRAAQRAPRLVVIEDVHWAPPAVRAYLLAIARILGDCPALMVLTTRPEGDAASDDWATLLDGLSASQYSLGPLSRAEANELAASFAVDDANVVEECIDRSGRNPLFLEQLLRSQLENASEALPTSIQTLVAAQVDRLEAVDKRAVQAAAVLGKQFDLEALRHVTGLADYECGALIERRLVQRDGSRMVFSHALVQEGVLSSLLRRDRQALHRAAAHWFAGRDAGLHARHLDRADDERAAAAYLEAARTEVASNRYFFAMDNLTRGLQLVSDRPVEFELCLLQGEVLTALTRTGESANAYERAADLADNPKDRCNAWLGAAEAMRTLGRYDEGLALLDEVEVLTRGDVAVVQERIHMHLLRGNICFVQMDVAGCDREQSQGLALARKSQARESEAWMLTGMVRSDFLAGRVNQALEHVESYLRVCDAHDLEHVRYTQLHMLGIALVYALRLDEAMEVFRVAREGAPVVGAPRAAILSTAFGAETLLDLGRHAEAAESARACIELSRHVGERRYQPMADALLIRAEARDEDRSVAERELRAIWDELDAGARAFSGWWVLGAVMLIAHSGTSRRWAVEQANTLPRRRSFGLGRLHFLHAAITAFVAANDHAAAEALATELEAFAGDELSPLSTLHIEWARAFAAQDRERIRDVRDEAARVKLTSMLTVIRAKAGGVD